MNMKSNNLYLVLPLLVFAIVVLFFALSPFSDRPLEVKVTDIEGSVTIFEERSNDTNELSSGDVVRTGSFVEVREGGRVEFLFNDEVTFVLDEQTGAYLTKRVDPNTATEFVVIGLSYGTVGATAPSFDNEELVSFVEVETSNVISSLKNKDAQMVVFYSRNDELSYVYATKEKVFVRGPTANHDANGLSIPSGAFTIVDAEGNARSPEDFTESMLPLSL